MSTAYYNEFDKFAAEWLRELIKAGLIAPGIVDDRSIEDVTPNDLRGFTQHHFFAGIGVWSYALRSAGWPDDRQVWTASCPCQPFSAAGKGAGFTDERHLWPALHHLVQECRPSVIVGEQVASKDAGPWIDLIHSDLEALGYAFGCVPFPSAGVGAPHIRDRAYWVAGILANNKSGNGWKTLGDVGMEHARHDDDAGESNTASVGYSQTNRPADKPGGSSVSLGGMGKPESDGPEVWRDIHGELPRYGLTEGRDAGGMADTDNHMHDEPESPNGASDFRADERGPELRFTGCSAMVRPGPTNGHWADADWLFCRDGKWRPVEPCTFPLAHGAPARVGRLRGYGNAVNAKAAQVFIESLLK